MNVSFTDDRGARSHPEQALLVVDPFEEPGRGLRAGPSQIQAVENNQG